MARPNFENYQIAGRVRRVRASKFGERKTWYGTRLFDSKREADYAAELDMLVRVGEVQSWEPQVRIRLEVCGKKICDYIVDFRLTLADGSHEYVEVKGFEQDVWKLKWKLFEALYPQYKKRVVK